MFRDPYPTPKSNAFHLFWLRLSEAKPRQALNGVRNRIRGDQVRSYVELSEAGPIASKQNGADQWAILKEESIKISEALVQIPFEQREVVVLHLHGSMKFREIAKVQSVSVKTIQSRYRYGLDKLRSILNSEVEK